MKALKARKQWIQAFGSILAACVLITGCSTTSTSPTAKIAYPSKARGWNGVDEVEFKQPYRFANYTALVVDSVVTNQCTLPPKGENTHEVTLAALGQADTLIFTEIERGLKEEIPVVAKSAPNQPTGKTLLLKVKVSEFNPGSVAARFWVGFGAGSGWVRMSGELVDASTQKTVMTFDQRRISSMRLDYKGMFAACTKEIGEDFARLIKLAEEK
jgi:Domain of unknown function (DUF4410)